MVDGDVYNVEYEGIHTICFTCGKADHDQKNCIIWKELQEAEEKEKSKEGNNKDQQEGTGTTGKEDTRREEENVPDVTTTRQNQARKEANNYGPWMVVHRRKIGKNESNKEAGAGPSNTKGNNANKFSILEIEETEETETHQQEEKQQEKKTKETGPKQDKSNRGKGKEMYQPNKIVKERK
ncbi:hypothetical protein PIB30_013596 [Stylosanthes scabra]|uniref:CCHC-type domain-containing protein n=1 Tax=Stylosanthes scabra TaxID=79078 RepID=A0ABU6T660_9FABA|nr:hypothetical protein [Stylosanthes scabra]